MAVLIRIDGWNPSAGGAVSLFAASDDDARICHLDDETWWPALATLPPLRYDLFSGAFDGKIDTPGSSFRMSVEPWPNFASYMLADAKVQIWTGEPGAAWADWTRRFNGRVTAQPKLVDGIADISIAVDDRWLDTPLLGTYAGTTGAEGPAALKGAPKPLSIGRPRYASGTMVDVANSVVQISAYGPIEDVEVALDRLSRFGAPSGDYASYAALVAANIPPGGWATAKVVGMARHGAPPEGKLCYHVKGDKAGPNGWARLPGQIIRRLALMVGTADQIDDASLDALDVVRPWPQSLMVTEQTAARELIQRIAASVNAVAGVSWLGKLFVAPVGIAASPVLTLAADGSTLPAVASVERNEVDAPYWRNDIAAERTWTLHDYSDIAFGATLVDRGRYSATETYREGHIVDLPDGSRWLHIGTAPTTGAAPPAGTSGDAVWRRLSAALSTEDIKYPDGTPVADLQPATPNATNGAPDGTYVGDRLAEQVVADLDLNAQQYFELIQLFSVRDQIMLARTTLDGKQIGTVVVEVREVAESTAEDVSLLGAKNGDGTAFNLNLNTVKVDGSTTLAQRFAQLEAYTDNGISALSTSLSQAIANGDTALAQQINTVQGSVNGVSAQVSSLQDVVVGPGGAQARSLNSVNVNGHITGTINTNDGTTGAFNIVSDIFRLIDPNSGNPFTAFVYEDSVLRINGTVQAQSYKVGSVSTPAIADNAVSLPDMVVVEGGGASVGTDNDNIWRDWSPAGSPLACAISVPSGAGNASVQMLVTLIGTRTGGDNDRISIRVRRSDGSIITPSEYSNMLWESGGQQAYTLPFHDPDPPAGGTTYTVQTKNLEGHPSWQRGVLQPLRLAK